MVMMVRSNAPNISPFLSGVPFRQLLDSIKENCSGKRYHKRVEEEKDHHRII